MAKNMSAKRALMTSVTAVTLSVAMLAGTTLAWFTDSITTSLNLIQTGKFKISATYQEANATADKGVGYSIKGFDRAEIVTFEALQANVEDAKIIDIQNWEPGAAGARLITVQNDGTLAAKVKLNFKIEDAGLQEVLWFDLLKIDEETKSAETVFASKPMSQLEIYADNLEIIIPPSENDEQSSTGTFMLMYGMNKEADNDYQTKAFNATVKVLATQASVESDDFGVTYDENAQYKDETTVTVAEGNTIHKVENGEQYEKALRAAKDGDAIEINGLISFKPGGDANQINKDLTIYGGENAVIASTIILGNANVTFKNLTFQQGVENWDFAIYREGKFSSKLIIDGCTFIDLTRNAIHLIDSLEGAEVEITNCTFKTTENLKGLQSLGNKAFHYIYIHSSDVNENAKIKIVGNSFENLDTVVNPIGIFRNVSSLIVGKNTTDNSSNEEFIDTSGNVTETNQFIKDKVLGQEVVELQFPLN